jgi:hypothetical protein
VRRQVEDKPGKIPGEANLKVRNLLKHRMEIVCNVTTNRPKMKKISPADEIGLCWASEILCQRFAGPPQ